MRGVLPTSAPRKPKGDFLPRSEFGITPGSDVLVFAHNSRCQRFLADLANWDEFGISPYRRKKMTSENSATPCRTRNLCLSSAAPPLHQRFHSISPPRISFESAVSQFVDLVGFHELGHVLTMNLGIDPKFTF